MSGMLPGSGIFYNYRRRAAEGGWDRRTFANHWWRLHDSDPHWSPPQYSRLRRELEPGRNRHLARMEPQFLSLEAMPNSQRAQKRAGREFSQEAFFAFPNIETTVATALVLADPRRSDRTGYLALLHWANDLESLERLVEAASEAAADLGCTRLVGPVGLSPYIESGLLESYWSEDPPLYTHYNPPYLPEHAQTEFGDPLRQAFLYHLPVGDASETALQDSGVRVVPLNPERLVGDLLSLFSCAVSNGDGFAPLDEAEAMFLLRWIGGGPVWGWLAEVDGKPVGFVLIQPDFSAILRLWEGGRRLITRGLMRLEIARSGRPGGVSRGRVVFGGVDPGWRRQGIGHCLAKTVLDFARERRWTSLVVGPLAEDSPGAALCRAYGAEPRQKYALYQKMIA